MSEGDLILGIPSKGRLMEASVELFAEAGMAIEKVGDERGYQGVVQDVDGVEVVFLSASEIAHQIRIGRIHLGVTGEDLIREQISDAEARVEFLAPLGFGHADVVVAVPECWVDVWKMGDLEDVAAIFARTHGRRLRVATKYMNLTRRFFAEKDVAGYRIVESLGATEGTPAAGTAELIVDITSTGATLKANALKILDDGVILQSEANFVASRLADWTPEANDARTQILERLGA